MEARAEPFHFYLERLSLVMTSVLSEPALPVGTSDPALCADVTSNNTIYGQSKVTKFTHVLSDLLIPSYYLQPLQLFHFLPPFSSINQFSIFLLIPTEPDI